MRQKDNEEITAEERSLGAFIADFRKSKKLGDPMQYAKASKKLIEFYGSPKAVSEKLGVGKETVRILSKLTTLPEEVQQRVSKREIPLTIAFDLVPLTTERQIETSRAIKNLSFKEARQIIRYIVENPGKSAEDARVAVMNALENREISVAMVAISQRDYDIMNQEDDDVTSSIIRMVEEWLANPQSLKNHDLVSEENKVSITLKLSRKTYHSLRKITRNPADLIEKVVASNLRREEKLIR
jgi:hypothetical protein